LNYRLKLIGGKGLVFRLLPPVLEAKEALRRAREKGVEGPISGGQEFGERG